MLASLALLYLSGLLAAALCRKIRLPQIVGMLAAGIVLGPCVLNLLDASLLAISAEIRQMALIVILIRAGLSLNLSDLKKAGRPALMMSFVPACFEILGYVLLAPKLLDLLPVEGAVMGAVLGAVSPAVVVPRMLRLMKESRGTDRQIPQLIMAGASCDDVFVIVLFSTFTTMAQGGRISIMAFAGIPISIVLGIAVGAAAGWGLAAFLRRNDIPSGKKTLLLLSTAFLLAALETLVKPYAAFSGLLAVISMACVVHLKGAPSAAQRLSAQFETLWMAAEIPLFVLVGAAVDIRYTFHAGIAAIGLILLALCFRAAGVLVCFIRTPLSWRERLFCIIAYLPKATVQAAIGSVPLTMGLPCGGMVLSVAVLSILITAPLGALGMDLSCRTLLRQTKQPPDTSGNGC